MSSTHRVRRGDSLSKIAARVYGDASLYPEIARANRIRAPYTIFEGQELIIPNSSSTNTSTLGNPASKSGSLTSANPSSSKKSSPVETIASPVLLPGFAFEHAKAIFKTSNGPLTIVMEYSVTLTMTTNRTIKNLCVVNFNRFALDCEHSAQAAAKDVAASIGSSVGVSVDLSDLSVELTPSISGSAGLDGEEWYQVDVKLVPNGLQYIYKPRSVKVTKGIWNCEGEARLVITVTSNEKKQQPQTVMIPIRALDVVVIIGAAVILTGLVVVAAPAIAAGAAAAGSAVAAGGAATGAAVSFGTAAVILGVPPYEQWKGSLGPAATPD